MTSGTEQHSRKLERLSAVLDGEEDEPSLLAACAAWRDDEGDRASWHAWHLIGDVMRSDDLASDAGRDADFLKAFRARLADEPVILAPAAVPVQITPAVAAVASVGQRNAGMAIRRRRSWTASAAVAAGFVAVAGAVFVMRPVDQPQQIAKAPPSAVPQTNAVQLVSAPAPAPMVRAPQIQVASGQMIRDARLQQYLAAHKQFGGASGLGMPAGALRGVTVETPNR